MLWLRFVIRNHSGAACRIEAILACPVSAIVISSSSRNKRMTCATSSAPPAVSPQMKGRPISTACAPSARALNASWSLRMPLSNRIVVLSPSRAENAANAGRLAGVPSSTRPP